MSSDRNEATPLADRLFVALQHVLPKLALTVFAGWVARPERGAVTTWIIRRFVRKYGVNMAEAAESDVAVYRSFNDFFTRALKEDARPLANAELICPVDGAISQFGPVSSGQIVQAKGQTYTVRALLGGDAQLAARFDGGQFATVYLSPKDYHRIHMPCDGELKRMIYVPGELFSVNPATARGVPGLFARNERVVCEFDTPKGPLALVLVGATIVGSMATVWHGLVNPPRRKDVTEWSYGAGEVVLKQGDEMGRFLLGSTVVLVWPQQMDFNVEWVPAKPVRLGEAMATVR
ncbi:archaetidylserine decarboxylase [Chitinibacteraceae bacterium HSL-7]